MTSSRIHLAVRAAVLIGGLGISGHAQDQQNQTPLARGIQADVWTVARTEWGDPDFEGTWLTVNTIGLPFQRPADPTDASLLRELVSAGALEAGLLNEGVPEAPRLVDRQMAVSEWRRTHFGWGTLVVDPEDGRLPPPTPAARQRAADQWRSTSQTNGPWNSAADLGPLERCISRGVLGSMLPSYDYHGIHILQAPGVIVIRNEAIHEARVIPLDGQPSPSPAIRSYMGSSSGAWDGDTLVVQTTNFNGRTGAHFSGNETPTTERLRLVERFTRVDEGTIDYEVTVEDADTWERPWKAAFPIVQSADYAWAEYACHEGNYALPNILSAARAADARKRPAR